MDKRLHATGIFVAICLLAYVVGSQPLRIQNRFEPYQNVSDVPVDELVKLDRKCRAKFNCTVDENKKEGCKKAGKIAQCVIKEARDSGDTFLEEVATQMKECQKEDDSETKMIKTRRNRLAGPYLDVLKSSIICGWEKAFEGLATSKDLYVDAYTRMQVLCEVGWGEYAQDEKTEEEIGTCIQDFFDELLGEEGLRKAIRTVMGGPTTSKDQMNRLVRLMKPLEAMAADEDKANMMTSVFSEMEACADEIKLFDISASTYNDDDYNDQKADYEPRTVPPNDYDSAWKREFIMDRTQRMANIPLKREVALAVGGKRSGSQGGSKGPAPGNQNAQGNQNAREEKNGGGSQSPELEKKESSATKTGTDDPNAQNVKPSKDSSVSSTDPVAKNDDGSSTDDVSTKGGSASKGKESSKGKEAVTTNDDTIPAMSRDPRTPEVEYAERKVEAIKCAYEKAEEQMEADQQDGYSPGGNPPGQYNNDEYGERSGQSFARRVSVNPAVFAAGFAAMLASAFICSGHSRQALY